jgi:Leucine-rich repeat (LRR) protein
MATIYYATGGASWLNNLKWLTNETECTWVQGSNGNFCGENNTTLQSLNLRQNGLSGKIPDEIGLLSSLTEFDLSNNQMSGSVLSGLFSLTALTYLDLSHNSFTGTVPSNIGSLTSFGSSCQCIPWDCAIGTWAP